MKAERRREELKRNDSNEPSIKQVKFNFIKQDIAPLRQGHYDVLFKLDYLIPSGIQR